MDRCVASGNCKSLTKCFVVLFISFGLVFSSCKETQQEGQNIVFNIDATPDFKVENRILHLPDGLLLGNIEQIECDDSCIYVLSSTTLEAGMHVFGKTSGEYLGRIGRVGRGPGEYLAPLSFTLTGNTACIVDGERVHKYENHTFRHIGSVETPFMTCFETSQSGITIADVNDYDSDSDLYGKAFATMNGAFECIEGYIDESMASGYITGPLKPIFHYGNAVRAYSQLSPVIYEFSNSGCAPVYNLSFKGLSFPSKGYVKRISSGNRDYTRKLRESGFISYYDFFETECAAMSMCMAEGKRYFGIYDKSSGKGYIISEEEMSKIIHAEPLMVTGVLDGKFAATVSVDLLDTSVTENLSHILVQASNNDILLQLLSL